MAQQSPRIYVYKITFEEVPYYYYGVHKEKKYNENYMGTPITNKWAWDFYTPQKQILEFFDYNDEGWKEAQKVEMRLIRPVYNTDKWCLNASCGGLVSLEILRKNYEMGIGLGSLSPERRTEIGKKNGKSIYERGVGVHGFTKERRVEIGKKAGKIVYESKLGLFARTEEEILDHNRAAGMRAYELGTGIHAQTHEDKVWCGMRTYELGVGVHALTSEEKSEMGRVGGIITSSQVWRCTITGYETNAGALATYQRNRNIDTSNRIRIK